MADRKKKKGVHGEAKRRRKHDSERQELGGKSWVSQDGMVVHQVYKKHNKCSVHQRSSVYAVRGIAETILKKDSWRRRG